ncbi:uncharacterized protein LOC134690730 isoform X2 [Mytilus trossulus]|uniref:uncharacterized protein LOC134690730 isoform X2 n=1 Tax=Mytilus trossulus TaxID=6551 RepID=UPI003003E776
MMSTFPPMVIGGVVITSLSFLLHIIAFSTTYWYTFGDVIHMGLWKSCYQSKGVEACSYYTELPVSDAHLIAAAVLESLALVAFVVAVICAFLKMFVLKEKGNMFAITGVFNLIAVDKDGTLYRLNCGRKKTFRQTMHYTLCCKRLVKNDICCLKEASVLRLRLKH